MTTLIVVIIICLAVLSTPLSLKKLIDRSKNNNGGVPGTGDIKKWIEDTDMIDDNEPEDDEETEESS